MHKQNRKPCEAIEDLNQYNDKFKKAVKFCLIENSENYCSYCDEYFWNIGNLVIEHFKSRKNYKELETEYSNLYAACNSCNSHKRDENYPAIEPLRPDNEDYDFDKYFLFEPDTGKIVALNNKIISIKTIDFLNLNNTDTKKARRDFWFKWFKNKKRPGKSFRFIEFEEMEQ